MSYSKDQFKATNTYDKALDVVYSNLCQNDKFHISGRNLFVIMKKFFIEKDTPNIQVTDEGIFKFCQFLINREDIYEESSENKNFQKSDSIFYCMRNVEERVNVSISNGKQKSILVKQDKKQFIKKIFGFDRSNLEDKDSVCFERKFALDRLLKILNISLIGDLIDLIHFSTICEHNNPGFNEMFQCDFFGKCYDVMSTKTLSSEVHCYCVINSLDNLRETLTNMKMDQDDIIYSNFVNILKYFLLHSDILKWNYLEEVFVAISEFKAPIEKKDKEENMIIEALQLTFSLLPKESLHITAHLFLVLTDVISCKCLEYQNNVYELFSHLFVKNDRDKFSNENYISHEVVKVIRIIARHSDKVFNLSPTFIEEMKLMKSANFESQTKIDKKMYEETKNETTETGLIELFINIKNQNNPKLLVKFMKMYPSIVEKVNFMSRKYNI